jgi:mediator of RNA polymerase II transcription subunit 12, fungi type
VLALVYREKYEVHTLESHVVFNIRSQFLNRGMKHISKTLDDIASPVDVEQMAHRITRAGDILRLVALIVQPFRVTVPPLQLDADVQDEIIPKICSKLEDMAILLADDIDASLVVPSVVFLARLLQFALTMTVDTSSGAKSTGTALAAVLTRLILVSGLNEMAIYVVNSGDIVV